MSAIMILCNHTNDDCKCLDTNATLLRSKEYFTIVEDENRDKQGAYLYFDTNDCVWIRTGKVTGRGFAVRHAEHQRKASANKGASKFYLRYPTKSSNRSGSSIRKGYFDNHVQSIAIGFDVKLDSENEK